jgi:hypothetical protein
MEKKKRSAAQKSATRKMQAAPKRGKKEPKRKAARSKHMPLSLLKTRLHKLQRIVLQRTS